MLEEASDYVAVVSVVVNIILLLVTFFTVLYARKTLLMEYSSQVIVRNITIKRESGAKINDSWEVDINNVGKGYIVKAYLLLSIPTKKGFIKQYFLSKPAVDIKPGEIRTIRLSLIEKYMNKIEVKSIVMCKIKIQCLT